MDWRVLAVGAMLMWGAWGVMAKITTARLGAKAVVLSFATAYFVVALLWTWRVLGGITRSFGAYHWLAIASGAVNCVGLILFYLALERTGRVGVLTVLCSQYVIIVFLIGAVAMHEPVSIRQVAGVALASLAIALLCL